MHFTVFEEAGLSVGFLSSLELYIFQNPHFLLGKKKEIKPQIISSLNPFPSALYNLGLLLSHWKNLLT